MENPCQRKAMIKDVFENNLQYMSKRSEIQGYKKIPCISFYCFQSKLKVEKTKK